MQQRVLFFLSLLSIARCERLRLLNPESSSSIPIPASSTEIKNVAKQFISNERKYTWNKQLSGSAWEFGLCSNSTAFGVPHFGARWPLKTGWITWYDQIPADNEVIAYAPKNVFVVLNQQYLSSFANEEEARQCNRPTKAPMDVSKLMGANAGGEPVLISLQKDDQSFCIHLRTINQGEEGHIDIFCSNDRVERRDWLDYLQDLVQTKQQNNVDVTTKSPLPPDQMYTQAPRTICAADGFCLTNSPSVHDNSKEKDSTSDTDDIKLLTSKWLKSFPITPIKAQEWNIEASSGKGSKVGTVNICSSSGKCLTVLKEIETSGLVPKAARKFIDCPGGNLKCFNMKHIKIGMTPTKYDTDACRNECDKETLCNGWVYTRPLATGTGFAKCCMKKRDMTLTCGKNRCCDAHMNSETTHGTFISNGAKVPKISNAIKMSTFIQTDLYQQWKIVPENGSNTNAKLKMGLLCVAVDPTSNSNELIMDDCVNGMVFTFQGFVEEKEKGTE